MNKSRKVFLVFAVIFFLILAYIGYDFGQKTTFPGSDNTQPSDTTSVDSLQIQG